MILIKTEADLVRMRVAAGMAAFIRDELASLTTPGLTTADLEQVAVKRMAEFGARSAFKGYRGFPGYICTSVNEDVVHGIPGPRKILAGDIVSIDVGVVYDGFVGDTAVTVPALGCEEEVSRLMEATQEALMAGIAQAVHGARLGDVSSAIESTVRKAGFSVVREFVGHGIGRDMHEEPQIPNYGPAGQGPRLRAGMTLAIEPMVNLGSARVDVMEDGWTVKTADRRMSAHFEHTVAVGHGSAEILSCAENAKV